MEDVPQAFPDYDMDHPQPDFDGESGFYVGAAVYHGQFGVGRVTEVEPGHTPRITVQFPDVGTRRIVAKFLSPYEGPIDEGLFGDGR